LYTNTGLSPNNKMCPLPTNKEDTDSQHLPSKTSEAATTWSGGGDARARGGLLHDQSEEAVVMLELEEAGVTVIRGGGSRAGSQQREQMARKSKDLRKNLHGQGNIYSAKKYQ
jgi:hypothetical protein